MELDDYSKYYIQNSDHYLIPKAIFVELYEEMANFRKESNESREVIDKAIQTLEERRTVVDLVKKVLIYVILQ